MRPDIGDDRAHHRARQRADANGRRRAKHKHRYAGVNTAILIERPGQCQAAEIGSANDGEVEAAGNDRHQHGQRQQPEFGQLKSNRIEIGEGQELRRRQSEHRNDQCQKADQPRSAALMPLPLRA